MSDVLTEQTKLFLVACMVAGIDVEYDNVDFMRGLVEHLNTAEREMWATGDFDGVIVHDKFDVPILFIKYDGQHLDFSIFGADSIEHEGHLDAGYMVINVVSYIQSLGVSFAPGTMTPETFQLEQEHNDDQDDWSL